MTPGPSRRAQLILVSSARSRKLSRVSVEAELLYFKLLLVTDDLGRFLASPLRVGAACFEHRLEKGDTTLERVRSQIRELENVELLHVYQGADGDSYLELLNLRRPVKSDRKAVVLYPDPDGSGSDPDGTHQPTPNPPPTPNPQSLPKEESVLPSSEAPLPQEHRPPHVDAAEWGAAVKAVIDHAMRNPTLGPQSHLLPDAAQLGLYAVWVAPPLNATLAKKDPERAARKQARDAVSKTKAVARTQEWLDDAARRCLQASNPVAYLRKCLRVGPAGVEAKA